MCTWLRSRFIGFSLVGLVIMVIGFAILALLVEILHIDKLIAGVITTTISVNLNFVANKYLNWADRPGKFLNQWWKFIVARLGVIVVNQLLYSVAVLLGLHYLASTLVLTLITTIINYFGNDRFVFLVKNQEKGKDDHERASAGFYCDSDRR
jgi:putative flippase GtrA